MSNAQLLDLIKRLEQTKGSDRELDADIWLTCVYPKDQQEGWHAPIPIKDWALRQSPNYTGSIDIAMLLKPDGLTAEVITYSTKAQASIWCEDLPSKEYEATASTPAVALCIAVLKAKAALS